jgi:hypothetical protein
MPGNPLFGKAPIRNWRTTGTPERQESWQDSGFQLIHSQSTLIHQTAIGGKKLIKWTWCENPVP